MNKELYFEKLEMLRNRVDIVDGAIIAYILDQIKVQMSTCVTHNEIMNLVENFMPIKPVTGIRTRLEHLKQEFRIIYKNYKKNLKPF